MEHMILGLLLLRSCSLYELRERMEKGMNLMYSSSMGSIQAAVKKLLKGGLITVEEDPGSRRKKKLYRITKQGKAAFLQWVSSPMRVDSARNPELGKLYFMGFSNREDRVKNLRETIASLRRIYQVLEEICLQGETMEVPEPAEEILRYQLASARYGRDSMAFQIQWYENFLQEEEKRI